MTKQSGRSDGVLVDALTPLVVLTGYAPFAPAQITLSVGAPDAITRRAHNGVPIMSFKAKKQQQFTKDPVALLPTVRSLIAEVAGLDGATTMTIDERRRAVKARGDASRLHDLALGIVTEHPELAVGLDLEVFQEQVRLAAGMRSLKALLGGAVQNLEDSILALDGKAWLTMLEIYSVSRTAARRLPDVGGLVTEMETLMAHGPRAKKVAAPTPAMSVVRGTAAPSGAVPATKAAIANPSPPANGDDTDSGDIAA